jgi:hypothetical protein
MAHGPSLADGLLENLLSFKYAPMVFGKGIANAIVCGALQAPDHVCFIIFLPLNVNIDEKEKVWVELTDKPMCCSKSGAGYGRESITCLLGRSMNW